MAHINEMMASNFRKATASVESVQLCFWRFIQESHHDGTVYWQAVRPSSAMDLNLPSGM